MLIQVNTDHNVEGGEKLTSPGRDGGRRPLGRFGDWITRVEVQLSDESSGSKDRDNDKRSVMEARPAGQQPISVSHQGATLDQALKGSARKLARVLNNTREQLDNPRGNTSCAGEQSN